MMRYTPLTKKRGDQAISPVIGTILMVAATVIIAGAVYAAVNAYNGKAAKAGPDASFKAQALDTDGDGLEDTIKVTYLAGPSNAESVMVTVVKADGSNSTAGASPTPWSPGEFQTFRGYYSTAPSDRPGSYYVTVIFGDTTILDQTLALKE